MQKIKNTAASIYLTLLSVVSTTAVAFADEDQGSRWEKFANDLVSLFAGIRPFVIAVVTVVLIGDAIGCIVGGEQSREQFRHSFPFVVAGALIVMSALMLANGLVKTTGVDGWNSSLILF